MFQLQESNRIWDIAPTGNKDNMYMAAELERTKELVHTFLSPPFVCICFSQSERCVHVSDMHCYNVSVLNIGLFQFSNQISVSLVSMLFTPALVNPIYQLLSR